MLITKQLKKSNNNIRYSISNPQPANLKPAGTKIKKNKVVKESKLHKNLSQIPIYLNSQLKENDSTSMANIMINRGYSSLVASDVSGSRSKSKKKADRDTVIKNRYQLFDNDKTTNIRNENFLPKKPSTKKNPLREHASQLTNKNYNSIPENKIYNRRESGISRSNSKWNNRSVEQEMSVIKSRLVENRKKYNLSCGDMIDKQSKSKSKSKSKDHSRIKKRRSTLNTTKINNPIDRVKDNQKQKSPKKKKNQKSKTKFKKMSIGGLKSKGSTALIQTSKLNLGKKKEKQPNNKDKQKKKKNKSKGKPQKISKPSKMFIFSKEASEEEQFDIESLDGYPINKYLGHKKGKNNEGRRALNIKVGVDYNNSKCLNMVSGSSGGVYGQMSSEVIARFDGNKKGHILEQIEYENTGSINIQQIKYYELNSSRERKKAKKQPQKMGKIRKNLVSIMEELSEEYPYLNENEVHFLASIVLIQRKWREISMFRELQARKKIVTEYFVEEHRASKDNDESKLIDLSKQKQQTISRTKVGEFQFPQNEKPKTEQQVRDQGLNYQTRKNTPTQRYKISIPSPDHVFQDSQSLESPQIRMNEQKPESIEQVMTFGQRNTKTEKNSHNRETEIYQWIATKEVFPEMKYLQYRRNFIRQQFETTMKLITQDYSHQRISSQQFEEKKNELMDCYNYDIQNLKKTKHDMKKGYLRYIDCVNKVRQADPHTLSQSGLRKVSSEDNFISVLYRKIYKFDKEISEWSGASQSIQLLTKKILIRKQFYRPGSDRSSNKKDRQSFNDLRSLAKSSKSSFQLLKSSRDMVSQGQTLLVFQNTDKIHDDRADDVSSKRSSAPNIQETSIKQFRFSNEIFKSREASNQFTHSIDLKQPHPATIQEKAEPLDPEYAAMFIEDELIMKLARELQSDIHDINPTLVDMILIQHGSPEDMEDYQQEYEENDGLPFMSSLNRQLQNITTPRASLQAPDAQMDEHADTLFYLRQLINFIKMEEWEEQIVENMNNNQAFEAMAYLKFLRDFEVPDDEYTPMISNEKFIDWEATFINKYQVKMPRIATREEQDIFKQARAIFHRCIFQVFLGQLEKQRPFGERGKPFPWEEKYSIAYHNQMSVSELPRVMDKCMLKVDQYLLYRCGVISEKHFIGSEEDLERMHQENQDRIIQMLEQDLRDSPHQWYQVDEHILQLKLQLTYAIEQSVLEEMSDFLACLLVARQF